MARLEELHDSMNHVDEIRSLLPDDPEQALSMLLELGQWVVEKHIGELARASTEAINQAAESGANAAVDRVVAWLQAHAEEVDVGDRWDHAREIRSLAKLINKECRP